MLNKNNFFAILLVLLFSFNSKASSWTDWQEVDTASFVPIIFTDINDVIGNGTFYSWYSEGKMDAGKTAYQYWIENYTENGYLLINLVTMPPGFVIKGSGNDKKYIRDEAEFILNVDRKNNPLKDISKKDIERYRDVYNNVVPYVFFDYDNSVCIIIKKGYYKGESGYEEDARDVETLVAVFCKQNGPIDQTFAQRLINSIEIKK